MLGERDRGEPARVGVPQISVKLWGRSVGDLGEKEKILIKGTLAEGNVVIPKMVASFLPESLNLTDVKGEVLISQGMLEGKNIDAIWENEKVRNIRLRIGLEGRDAPFHVEGEMEIDLSKAPPIARQLLKDEAAFQEIARIEGMKGRARGRFILGESMETIRAKMEVEEINLAARYGRIPYAVEISEGQIFHEGKKIVLKDLRGRIGKSSFSGLTGHIELGERAYLEVKEEKASVVLEEIYRWLSSYVALQPALEGIRSLNGTSSLSILDLSGPLPARKNGDFMRAVR